MFWLWVFGSVIEPCLGRPRYGVFVLTAAVISSLFQIAHTDETGIGASGIVCAMFGLLWTSRSRVPEFRKALTSSRLSLLLFWMAFCLALDYFRVMAIGNAAHVFGFLFGGAIGLGYFGRWMPRVFRTLAVGLIIVGLIPLYWCPWSGSWLATQAYEAHVAEDFESAISWYSRLIQIQRDPENAWAYLNRSYAYNAVGNLPAAHTDYRRALKMDPDVEQGP